MSPFPSCLHLKAYRLENVIEYLIKSLCLQGNGGVITAFIISKNSFHRLKYDCSGNYIKSMKTSWQFKIE
jgi:hypothetical protein